ncbi:hypothetical protein AAG747_10610 [Rapidithrix thailandica]|uniref:Uncharacterized protein n=1 Tax=Rapidithrix thailandica TaxID=413964 RepID=A0AAW9SCA6_9BACT
MKKIAIFLVFLTGCIPYKSYLKTDDICGFDMMITEEEKRIDPQLFANIKEPDYPFSRVIMSKEGDNFQDMVFVTKSLNDKELKVIRSITDKKNFISKTMIYRTNGSIKSSSFSVDGNFLVEVKNYDSLGNITQVIDHRHANNYPICFKEALMIAEKLKPKKDSIFGIDREWEATVTDTLYYWEVFVQEPKPDKDEPTLGDAWIYRIDAQTGKLLRKMQLIQGHDDTFSDRKKEER